MPTRASRALLLLCASTSIAGCDVCAFGRPCIATVSGTASVAPSSSYDVMLCIDADCTDGTVVPGSVSRLALPPTGTSASVSVSPHADQSELSIEYEISPNYPGYHLLGPQVAIYLSVRDNETGAVLLAHARMFESSWDDCCRAYSVAFSF